MNKKAIFITLYLAIACFVGIGTYTLIDSEVVKRQTQQVATTTEYVVSETDDQVGIIDSIDSHVANQKGDETTEYMADQLSPDFECYDKENPDNPAIEYWYTPTTKATTEEKKTEATTQAPGNKPGTTAATTATTQAITTTETTQATTTAETTAASTEASTAASTEASTAASTEASGTE